MELAHGWRASNWIWAQAKQIIEWWRDQNIWRNAPFSWWLSIFNWSLHLDGFREPCYSFLMVLCSSTEKKVFFYCLFYSLELLSYLSSHLASIIFFSFWMKHNSICNLHHLANLKEWVAFQALIFFFKS